MGTEVSELPGQPGEVSVLVLFPFLLQAENNTDHRWSPPQKAQSRVSKNRLSTYLAFEGSTHKNTSE